MQDIGTQYKRDDLTDRSGFLRRARLHQSRFRAEILNLPCGKFGNYLTKEDGEKGKIYFDGFGIFEAVKNYRPYNEPLYSNMLRSEHIPFNFFIPFHEDKTFCKNVFNIFLRDKIKSIDEILIEYAPAPKENYLGDLTSFDTYIEYTHIDGSKGIIGIEVKYTEREYLLKAGSKEGRDINDITQPYFLVTNNCGIYKPNSYPILITDKFRQVWRNHILGESILLVDKDKFKHFTSMTFFPKDNTHFVHTSKEYIDLLKENSRKFLPVTYEDFFEACNNHYPNNNYKNWLDYLNKRYIVTD
jgi:hypothetical protein